MEIFFKDFAWFFDFPVSLSTSTKNAVQMERLFDTVFRFSGEFFGREF